MQTLIYILLLPLILVWFLVILSGGLIAGPILSVLKRPEKGNSPETYQEEVFIGILCGLLFVGACVGVGVWLLVSR